MVSPSVLSFPALALLLRFTAQHGGAVPQCKAIRLEHMLVKLASKDVSRVRRLLADEPHTAVLQCTPLPESQDVHLDIQFPAGHSASVIQRIVACTGQGIFGRVVATGKGATAPTPRGTLAEHPSETAFAQHGK